MGTNGYKWIPTNKHYRSGLELIHINNIGYSRIQYDTSAYEYKRMWLDNIKKQTNTNGYWWIRVDTSTCRYEGYP